MQVEGHAVADGAVDTGINLVGASCFAFPAIETVGEVGVLKEEADIGSNRRGSTQGVFKHLLHESNLAVQFIGVQR